MEKNTKTIKITDLKHPAYNPREIKREDIGRYPKFKTPCPYDIIGI